MRRPQISVVIPVWNDKEWLGGAVESVLAQTFPDWELVIGDNASEDHLAEILRRYEDPRIRYTRWSRHVGASENHNRSMMLARYPWIQVLCADDRLRPTCLDRIASAITQTAKAGIDVAMVLTACQRVDEQGQPADIIRQDSVRYLPVRRQAISGGVYDPPRWLMVNAMPGLRPWMIGSVAIKSEILGESGGFRPEMGLSHDLELAMRVSAYGDVAYIDEPLLDYTVRAGSITMQLERRHVRSGGPMVEEGLAWLSALRTHELRRSVTRHERAVVSSAIARAFLRRALLQRRRNGYVRARRHALADVLRAVRHSPATALGSWRIGVAVSAILAPDWLLSRATTVAHRFGMVVV
jgi:glycosyltransferase involved in cell wall biosynthesis